jgi:hypothetical protein
MFDKPAGVLVRFVCSRNFVRDALVLLGSRPDIDFHIDNVTSRRKADDIVGLVEFHVHNYSPSNIAKKIRA